MAPSPRSEPVRKEAFTVCFPPLFLLLLARKANFIVHPDEGIPG